MKSLREIVGPYKETEPIIYDSDGINRDKLAYIMELKNIKRERSYK